MKLRKDSLYCVDCGHWWCPYCWSNFKDTLKDPQAKHGRLTAKGFRTTDANFCEYCLNDGNCGEKFQGEWIAEEHEGPGGVYTCIRFMKN